MTRLRSSLLRCIHLSGPPHRKGYFLLCLSEWDKPPAHHPSLLETERGGVGWRNRGVTPVFSRSVSLFLISFPACHKLTSAFRPLHTNTHRIFLSLSRSRSTRRPYYFPAGRPLLSKGDEWLRLLYRFPN